MPPKRRGGQSAAGDARGQKKARQSKLAKENDITAEEEIEVKEGFRMFSVKSEDFPSEKEGVMPAKDVRRALIALGLPPEPSELPDIMSAVDPESTGYVGYETFLSVAALKLHSRTEDSMSAEVEHAFKLFTRGSNGPISLGQLRKVARDLKEAVDDDLLKDMIKEANGGSGVNAGVNVEQFREVMMRAGIF